MDQIYKNLSLAEHFINTQEPFVIAPNTMPFSVGGVVKPPDILLESQPVDLSKPMFQTASNSINLAAYVQKNWVPIVIVILVGGVIIFAYTRDKRGGYENGRPVYLYSE